MKRSGYHHRRTLERSREFLHTLPSRQAQFLSSKFNTELKSVNVRFAGGNSRLLLTKHKARDINTYLSQPARIWPLPD